LVLISFQGAPSWYITLSPADNKHPISLYYADTNEKFEPLLCSKEFKNSLIADNPVASARFFHFIVENFIKHVLGVGTDHPGLYGDTSAYYGTVEQQGRLTLHIHMLLWIRGSLTPQEVRERIMDPNSEFQREMVEYLESVHMGEFMTGKMEDVKKKLDIAELDDKYVNPTETLPIPPSVPCGEDGCGACESCMATDLWEDQFKTTVDDILFRSNVHKCTGSPKQYKKKQGKNKQKGSADKFQPVTGCLSNKWGKCKARFPRTLFEHTEVDMESGALNIKKGEAMLNTVTAEVTYLIRSNLDVTSLLSGTAIKAVVAYISDYISKPSLKTYLIFEAVKSVFDKNSEMLGGTLDRREKTRKLLTQIVNSLTSKMEIGGPMASMYLLGNPDHYTSHNFRPFYWSTFVRAARHEYHHDTEDSSEDKLVLLKVKGKIVGRTIVQDYMFRPEEFKHISLYDWMRLSVIKKCTHKEMQNCSDDDAVDTHNRNDDDGGTESTEIKFHCFLKDHPLYHSTKATLCDESDGYVPNFIGGVVPRSNRGDREYYCSAMLTFFKPWRNGKDLRSEDQNWDEAFNKYSFTPRQTEIMKYFNVRYECLDARDDYAAQMKKGQNIGIFGNWEVHDNFEQHDTDGDGLTEGDGFMCDANTMDDDELIGPVTSKRNRDMDRVEEIMRTSGWFNESPDGPPDFGDLNPIVPSHILPGKEWAAKVQQQKQDLIAERSKNLPTNRDIIHGTNSEGVKSAQNYGEVKIVDKSYLSQDFKADRIEDQSLIDRTVIDFLLNSEQERAFRIVANHATSKNPEQLKMYLGGMGGTGKSRVIQALNDFFKNREESYRMTVVAPTGNAAALIGGSTYHSVLGINDRGYFADSMSKVRARLDGVNYVFLDEVSMLSCHDMYRFCAQLSKVFNEPNLPFGGINVIFAGDFAQLPPVGGGEAISLYSGNIGTQIYSGMSHYGQESAIGRALWHQVTTVVILRQNMRQKNQSSDDIKFRTALENMRYRSCTSDDIEFLRSRVTGPGQNRPKLAEKRFRNVSIITAWNSQKDRINEMGCARFAKATGQPLVHLYSVDKWVVYEDFPDKMTGRRRKRRSKVAENCNISPTDQEKLWDLPYHATDHFPGKLSICMGMPVMIRHNDATELCITKGQEGTIAGWQACKGPHGQIDA
jgi:hypothetical protein